MDSVGGDSSETRTSLISNQLHPVRSKDSALSELPMESNEDYIKDDVYKRNVPWYRKYKLKWGHIITFSILYAAATYGFLTFPYIRKYKTVLWILFLYSFGILGITAGAHRLWSHKAYKAKLPLQILLAIGFLTTLQVPFSHWIRVHRVHHKYTDTDFDPHDSRKGFFFSHLGWLLTNKPKDVANKCRDVDMSDIKKNPVIAFMDRNIGICALTVTAATILIPVYFWNEEWKYALMSQIMRFMLAFNSTVSVNSVAHMWGNKPFNRSIKSVDNKILTCFVFGEGWHNYHHVFPFDYRTPEFTGYIDLTGKLIESFEKIGWAYDLRKPTDDFVRRVIKNKGDEYLQALVN